MFGLSDPSINSLNVWLSTFEKCWLRSKYPTIYDKEKEHLLSNLPQKSKKKKKRTLRKTYAIRKQLSRLLINEDTKSSITVIDAGVLYVNIIQAVLPQSHISIITAPYTYCTFYVTNNDPCYGATKIYSTKTQHDMNPKWNESHHMLITNTTGQLIIEIYSKNTYTDDTLIGSFEMELNHLVLHYYGKEESADIDEWFQLALVKQTHELTKNDSDDDNHTDDEYNDYIRSMSDTGSNGRIHLQIKLSLKSPFWSHFISHFDPVLPQPQKVTFNANLCYIEAYKIYLLIDQTIIQGTTGSDTIFWRKWIYSTIALFLIASFVYYPWFLSFCMKLILLIALCTSYATNKTKRFKVAFILHAICICFGGIPAMAINKNKQKLIKEEEEEVKDEKGESLDMPKVTKFCVKRILEATDNTQGLWFFQEVLVWINEFIFYLKENIEWKYVAISSMMVIALFIGCILSLILKDTNFVKHEFFAIIAFLFCFYSKPMQFVLWLMIGICYYHYNYHTVCQQYKLKQKPMFIRTKALEISYSASLRETFTPNRNKCNFLVKIIKYTLTPLVMNTNINITDETEYDASELCKLSLMDHNSKHLCCKSTANICLCDSNDCIDEAHIFYSIPIASSRIALKSCNINTFVSAQSNGKITNDKMKVFECEIFQVMEEDNCNKIALRSCHRKYISSDGHNELSQKNKISESETFTVEVINRNDDNGEEIKMENILHSDQLSTHNTYLFAAKEKQKATILREKIIRNIVNDKQFALILAKLKNLKLISF